MSDFLLRIYTAEHPFFEGECGSLIVPTTDGPYGILAHHIDMIAALESGELKYRKKGNSSYESVAVSPGIVTVENNEVTVLTETAELASEIDYARAMKQYKHAKERLEKETDLVAHQMAKTKLSRAMNRLKVRSVPGKK